jgi:hypothetical protein
MHNLLMPEAPVEGATRSATRSATVQGALGGGAPPNPALPAEFGASSPAAGQRPCALGANFLTSPTRQLLTIFELR